MRSSAHIAAQSSQTHSSFPPRRAGSSISSAKVAAAASQHGIRSVSAAHDVSSVGQWLELRIESSFFCYQTRVGARTPLMAPTRFGLGGYSWLLHLLPDGLANLLPELERLLRILFESVSYLCDGRDYLLEEDLQY